MSANLSLHNQIRRLFIKEGILVSGIHDLVCSSIRQCTAAASGIGFMVFSIIYDVCSVDRQGHCVGVSDCDNTFAGRSMTPPAGNAWMHAAKASCLC
jgi:hypothetical protein